MTHDYGKPSNIYAQLGSIRMSAAERRDAIANLKRGEAIADLILRAADLPRRATAGITRAFVKLVYRLLTKEGQAEVVRNESGSYDYDKR
jgi:hypothetical protein